MVICIMNQNIGVFLFSWWLKIRKIVIVIQLYMFICYVVSERVLVFSVEMNVWFGDWLVIGLMVKYWKVMLMMKVVMQLSIQLVSSLLLNQMMGKVSSSDLMSRLFRVQLLLQWLVVSVMFCGEGFFLLLFWFFWCDLLVDWLLLFWVVLWVCGCFQCQYVYSFNGLVYSVVIGYIMCMIVIGWWWLCSMFSMIYSV